MCLIGQSKIDCHISDKTFDHVIIYNFTTPSPLRENKCFKLYSKTISKLDPDIVVGNTRCGLIWPVSTPRTKLTWTAGNKQRELEPDVTKPGKWAIFLYADIWQFFKGTLRNPFLRNRMIGEVPAARLKKQHGWAVRMVQFYEWRTRTLPELTWAALHIFVDSFLCQVYICLASRRGNSHLVQGSRKRSFFTTESGSTVEFEIGFSSEYSMILFWSQLKSTWLPARLNTHDQSADHFSRMAILHSQLYSPIRIHQNKYAALPHITSNPTCSAIFSYSHSPE